MVMSKLPKGEKCNQGDRISWP